MSKKKQWQPWNLYTHGVSWSFVSTFLQCKWQCRHKYVNGFYKDTLKTPFVFGGCVHSILERVTRTCTSWPSWERIQKYAREFDKDKPAPRHMPEYRRQCQLAAVVANEYYCYYPFEYQRNWLDIEQNIRMAYQFDDGRTTFLNGYIDAKEQRDNGVYLWDHKCLSKFNAVEYADEMPVSFQFNLYGYMELMNSGTVPGGFVMNIVRSPNIKQGKTQTWEEYLERIRGDIDSRPAFYFQRVPYEFSEGELLEWAETYLHPIMADIQRWQDEGFPAYPNPVTLKWGYSKSEFYEWIVNGFKYLYENKGIR